LQPQTFAKEQLKFENLAGWQTFVSCCLSSRAEGLFAHKLLPLGNVTKIIVLNQTQRQN
jgi:hypothetical protein